MSFVPSNNNIFCSTISLYILCLVVCFFVHSVMLVKMVIVNKLTSSLDECDLGQRNIEKIS